MLRKILSNYHQTRCTSTLSTEVERLHSRAIALVTKFLQGEANCIEEAIDLDREALGLCPPGHPLRPTSLTWLARHLGDRYERLGAMKDIEEAIVLDQEALKLCPKGHSHRPVSLTNFSLHLSIRHSRFGAMEDLDAAISLDQEALCLLPQAHPNRTISLNNFALRLYTRYKILGVMKDLDEATALHQEALRLRPQGHVDRPSSLNNLANCLTTRYNQLGVMKDLDEAIVLHREALRLRQPGHPGRAGSLNNLAICLSIRFDLLGVMEDLDESIVLTRESLQMRPHGHPDRSMSLNNLAFQLSIRYKQLGIMEDLDEAITLDREALESRPPGHPGRYTLLNGLSADLFTRYKNLQVTEDLDTAIVLCRESLDLLSKGHPARSLSLVNLAQYLCTRYEDSSLMEDLDGGILLAREALDAHPKGHHGRPVSLNNLASYLTLRYRQLRVMEDLDEAIALAREALCLCPHGRPDRSMSLVNLAWCLFTRYNQLCAMGDLDEAISLVREAHGLHPKGHPDRSRCLENLGRFLFYRFKDSAELEDQEELFSLYFQLAESPRVVSVNDLEAAKAWVNVAEHFRHPTTLLAHETALQLLIRHLATLPSLPQNLDLLKRLTSSLAVDAFSACLRHCSPTKAVELLEQGRGVFWSQLTRLRSPIDDVIASGMLGKDLAAEFTRLTSLIRDALNSPDEEQHALICHLNIQMQSVVNNIRALPGLSRFLLPSVFTDLQLAASEGPVIIVNASEYSCDALVVLLDRDPVHIPLQITQERVRDLSMALHALTVRATRADVTKDLSAFLRTIWDQIVSPIVAFLQTIYPPQSRIWWCPTGDFSVLPLHAASPFRKGEQSLPQLYVSSYTPTLTALIRARRDNPSSCTTQGKRFIAIGEANAGSEAELPCVGAELDTVSQLVRNLATFTRIEGEESCMSRVVQELGENEWVHLSCHGIPDRTSPFESAFALHDGRFTIQRILGCDLKNPEFAYLSACHTTVGDEEGPDEVIHLASAMQFIGFRSVIGTMWAVDDGETCKIASTFYKHMVDESGRLDHTRAALALNKTMRSVRIPLDQRILYIHLGA